VLHLGNHLQKLQQQDPDFYKYLLEQISSQMDRFNAAMQYASNLQQQQEQQQNSAKTF